MAYERIRREARSIAGAPGDILPRVRAHHAVYVASGKNHVFPLIALHGALWAYGFFEVTGTLGEIVSYRYALDADERARRHAMVDAFAEGFRAVNREVFVDTYTSYHFTARHGEAPGAETILAPRLLDALNEVHHANARGAELPVDRKRHVFETSLLFEQEATVAPGVARELARFDCPILRGLCMRPVVRFSYFGLTDTFFFRDFSDKEERIARAMTSFDLACERGWDEVERSMASYGV
jgi:hypothetical protein